MCVLSSTALALPLLFTTHVDPHSVIAQSNFVFPVITARTVFARSENRREISLDSLFKHSFMFLLVYFVRSVIEYGRYSVSIFGSTI
jgi:hypothetical protein